MQGDATEIKAMATARETNRKKINTLHPPNHDLSILVKGLSLGECSKPLDGPCNASIWSCYLE